MPEAFVIRRLAGPDVHAYKSLRDEMLAAHPSAFTSDAASQRTRPAESYLPRLSPEADCFTLGAVQGDALIGAISCERDPRTKVRHVGQVIGMMVRAGFEGKGVGRGLLAACIAQAKTAGGIEMLTLSVTSDNRRAVDLYRRAGFSTYGTLPAAIRVDAVYHAKDLMVLKLA